MKHDFDDAPTIPRVTFLPAPDLDPVEWDAPTTPRQDPVIHDQGFGERETLDIGPAARARRRLACPRYETCANGKARTETLRGSRGDEP